VPCPLLHFATEVSSAAQGQSQRSYLPPMSQPSRRRPSTNLPIKSHELARPADLVTQQSTVSRRPNVVQSADRSWKADRLKTSKAGTAALPLAATEVIGAEDVSIRFRSRLGQVPFQSDPLTSTTYIAEGMVWPPVVVRAKPSTTIEQRFPEPITPPARRPAGCEPITSGLADPGLSNIIGRCIAMATALASTCAAIATHSSAKPI